MGRGRRNRSNGNRVWTWAAALLVLAIAVVVWSHNQRPFRSVYTDGMVAKIASAAPKQKSTVNQSIVEKSAEKVEKPVPETVGIRCGHIELPWIGEPERVVWSADGRYTYCYAPEKRQSRWVAYKLTRSDVGAGAGRSDSFREDPQVPARGWVGATNGDYRNSGYDKGHLVPSADRSRSVAENRATFLFSNISPQVPKLNRGPWKELEEALRRSTQRYDTLYIVAGGVTGGSDMPVIGRSRVGVAKLFYKAIVFRKGDRFEAAAYVMPNREGVARDYKRYGVSVDSVERLTGLDLFPAVDGL